MGPDTGRRPRRPVEEIATLAVVGIALLGLAWIILTRTLAALIPAALAADAGLDGRIGPFVAGYVLVLAVGSPLLAARGAQLARLFPATLLRSGGTS